MTTLTILETSDIHGNIFPLNYGTNKWAEVGLGKVATLINQERTQAENSLLIDNGDLIQGTPLTYHFARYNLTSPNPMVLILNELGYDCAVFGNHEFNYGQDILKQAIKESHFPWLSANIINTKTNQSYCSDPYYIKEFEDGLKVGVLGLTTHYIPNWEKEEHIQNIKFKDALETAKEWVPKLRPLVDVLIVSYHGGFECDLDTGKPNEILTGENQAYEICQQVKGIDILLTGHQHRKIADKNVNGVIVLQPGSQGMYLGKIKLKLMREQSNWRIVDSKSELVSVEGVGADQSLLNKVASYERDTQVWLDQPIGKIQGDMKVHDPLELKTKDNALIEFFNRIQMEVAGVDISCTALFDNQSPGLTEDVTMRDIVANYIYPNSLRVLRLSGQDIKDALEKSASYFAPYDGGPIKVNQEFVNPKPQHYNYDMWEGIHYKINISRPFGERILDLTYKGKLMCMNASYDVVLNNYRAGGGGDYFMFQNKPVVKDIPVDVSEIIANYMLERGTIKATVDHNWEVIHD